ncbi:hypothetical protein [Erythrobacter oryzae]|uniref:hypothetical protein n=1 Tax=Erythrobacter oryzae TaxID=3019556 RepID=UPI00255235A5|nr:hypothetical protein [Erythrobacter sp. COR-2]
MSLVADLAGALRALERLRPSSSAARIAICAGFRVELVEQREERPAPAANSASPPLAPPRRSEPGRPQPAPQRPEPRPTEIEQLEAQPTARPQWLGKHTIPAPPLPEARPKSLPARPAGAQPCLLPLASRRSLLLELTARKAATGPLDLARLVDQVARGRQIGRLPRRAASHLPARILLLLDAGPGMDPFAADQLAFAAALRRAVGHERIRVLRFAGSIVWGPRDPRAAEGAGLGEVQAGDAIVILGDLGIGPRSLPLPAGELDALTAKGCRVLVLNPYPPDRWPAAMGSSAVILHWHEALRSADLRKARTRAATSGPQAGASDAA